jgi:hypothetical protein
LKEINEKEHETLNIIDKIKQDNLKHCHNLEKEVIVKATVIEGQQSKINELEDRLAKVENILEKQINNKKEVPRTKPLKCTKCQYETNSRSGFKVHQAKKHTSVDKVKFPKNCDICGKEFKTATEMKKHIKSHSYKQAKFKCDDCDFVCCMEVHIGKEHSDIFECGLCQFEAQNFENLDIQLNLCGG